MKGLKLIATAVIVSTLLILTLALWHQKTTTPLELIRESEQEINGPLVAAEQEINHPNIVNEMNPIAIIKTNYGEIELELLETEMPITVGNFVSLAESGFYNSTKIHRVIEGFMIQGGDPNTKGENESIYGQGGPGKTISDEFVEGELLTNTRGTIAMANTGQPNSGGSQWFINLVDNTGLDFNKPPLSSKHPVFGRVVKGMDVVDTIGKVETKERDMPVEPIVIESVMIKRN